MRGDTNPDAFILAIARKLFRQNGPHNTTIAAIAKHGGMSPANVYRFFRSKEDLRQAVCRQLLDENFALALAISGRRMSAGGRIALFIRLQFKILRQMIGSDPNLYELLTLSVDRDWHSFDQHLDRVQVLLAEIIVQGIQDQQFAPQDPKVMASVTIAAVASLCHPILVAQNLGKQNRAKAYHLIDFVISALKRAEC